ncbi:sortase-dependent protein [Streptomyces sp. NPDC032940]|uniref:sortase-dependent protein n=1 Tax=Streptomyces sp. NPDC032940 TaxID=3155366 RepID=UPI0033F86FA2
MRRTILSALALACTAVLASTAPAFADDPTAAPSSPPATATPSTGTEPTRAPSPVPSVSSPAPSVSSPAPSAEPTSPPADGGQVSAVPEGAPDTGATTPQSAGNSGTLVGAGAGTLLAAGGAVAFVVRRRRATGA